MKTAAAAILLLSTTAARAADVRTSDALLRGQSSAAAAAAAGDGNCVSNGNKPNIPCDGCVAFTDPQDGAGCGKPDGNGGFERTVPQEGATCWAYCKPEGGGTPAEYEWLVNQPPMPPDMTDAAKDAERVIKEMVAEAAGALPDDEKAPFPTEDTADAILREVIQSNINELKEGSTVDGVTSEMMTRFEACWKSCVGDGVTTHWKTCTKGPACNDQLAKWAFDQYKSEFGVVFWTGGATGVAQAQAAQFCKKLNENPSLSPYITLEGSLIGGFMDRFTNPDKSRLFHNDCGKLLAEKGAAHTAVDPGLSRIAQRAMCHERGYDKQSSDVRGAKIWHALRLPESKKAAFDAAWATRDGWREENNKLPQRMCYRLTMGTTKTCSRLGGLWGTVSDALAAKTDTTKVIYSIQRAPKMSSFYWAPFTDAGGEMNSLKIHMTKETDPAKSKVRVVVVKTSGCEVEQFYDQKEQFYCKTGPGKFVEDWAKGKAYKGTPDWIATIPEADESKMLLLNQHIPQKGGDWTPNKGTLQICTMKAVVESEGPNKGWGLSTGTPAENSPEGQEWERWKDGQNKEASPDSVDVFTSKLTDGAEVKKAIDSTAPKPVFAKAPYPLSQGKWPMCLVGDVAQKTKPISKDEFTCLCSRDGVQLEGDEAFSCMAA